MKVAAEIENLSFTYEGSNYPALKNITLKLEKGRRYLLTGRSGSGKTTLARSLTGLIPHFYSGEYKGDVWIEGRRVRDTSIEEISRIVGYLRQNPEDQILMTTVERDIAFSLEFRLSDPREIRSKVVNIMKRLGIQHLWGRRVDSLSGGELQKVALAGILVTEPSIVILDEPSAYLSPYSVEKLKEFLLEKLPNETTLIVIDHRLDYWITFVDQAIYMEHGEILYVGRAGKLLNMLKSINHGLNIPLHIKLTHDIASVLGGYNDKC